MKGLVWFLVVAGAAVALALAARYEEGYVLLVVPPYRVEASLTLVVVAVLVGFTALYAVVRLVSQTLSLPAHVAAFRERHRRNRGIESLRGAWQAYFEGRFSKAEKLARRAYDLEEAPAVSALLAARASHQMRDAERRETWLARADEAPGGDRQARLATRAELLLDERRFEEAHEVLTELARGGPKQVATQRLMLRAEQGLRNWDEVLRLATQLAKRDAISAEVAGQLRITATVENLRKKALDADSLAAFWSKLPAEDRRSPRIAAAAVDLFARLGGCRKAHQIAREALEANWDASLVLRYGECATDDALERLEVAERWLKKHPRDSALHLTLGRLCVEQALWGKARSHLEASLAEQPSRAAHIELARLFESIGREDDATLHYRAAAQEGLPAEPR